MCYLPMNGDNSNRHSYSNHTNYRNETLGFHFEFVQYCSHYNISFNKLIRFNPILWIQSLVNLASVGLHTAPFWFIELFLWIKKTGELEQLSGRKR